MQARLRHARSSTLVPATMIMIGAAALFLFWVVERGAERPFRDPRGIPRCQPGAEDDLLSATALRCWLDAPRGGQWRTLSRAWAFRALVVKAEASDVADAEEIARRWAADCGDEFSEILVYVQREAAPTPTLIRRVQWTPARGFETLEFTGRLTQ